MIERAVEFEAKGRDMEKGWRWNRQKTRPDPSHTRLMLPSASATFTDSGIVAGAANTKFEGGALRLTLGAWFGVSTTVFRRSRAFDFPGTRMLA